MNLPAGIAVIVGCVTLHAFFAGCEMGIVSVNPLRLRHKLDAGDRIAALIQALLDQPEKLFGTILVGTNICVIVATTTATVLVRQHLVGSERLVAIISTAIMFPLFMILGEIIPKTIARKNSDKLVPRLVPLLRIFHNLLLPIVFVTTGVSRAFALILGRVKEHKNPFVTREELKLLLREGLDKRKLHTSGKDMIYRIFDLEETCASEIMVPLINVAAVEVGENISETVRLLKKSGYSRLPVYQDRIDNIIGIVAASDLIAPQYREKPLSELMREPYRVPSTKPIDDILREMQQKQKHMAIVVDKYGRVSGILTNEDIIEEIVGEIEDEHDRRQLVRNNPGPATEN